VMGHSTGGLLTYMIADRGLSAASVAIDAGPFRGVLPLPLSALKSAGPVLRNPLNRGRAITLTLDQFKYGWANALDETEARQLYDTYHVAGPGVALMQMANANLNPFTEAKVDPRNPARGPLLIIEGEKDHTVPWAIANAAYKRQKHNESVTEITRIPNRGHSLTIDSGWREVAQTALDFVKRSSAVKAGRKVDHLRRMKSGPPWKVRTGLGALAGELARLTRAPLSRRVGTGGWSARWR
jgi:non-heme chloroperoxidase